MASNLRFGLKRFALKSSWSGFPQLWLLLLLGPRQVILATALYPLNSSQVLHNWTEQPGTLLAKTDNYVLLTLQIDFETSLHIYVHLNKVVKTKRTFSKHCIGLVNIVFGEDDSAAEVPLEPGGVACLPPRCCCTDDDQQYLRLVLPAWQQAFFHATPFLFLCLTPSTRTGFAHNLKCGVKNGISDGYSTVVPSVGLIGFDNGMVSTSRWGGV